MTFEKLGQGAMLAREEFESLSRERGATLVSLYLPTHRFGPGVEGDPIRLKNLLGEARARGVEIGRDGSEIDETLEPARALLADSRFWQHQGDGLGLFLSGGAGRLHRLPTPVEELVYIGGRYCVRPLLPIVSAGEHFYVLALSQKSVRLLSCTRDGAREVDLHDIPASLTDAVGYDWEQRTLQFHTGAPRTGTGQRPAIFHGHGGGGEDSGDEIERFVRAVDGGLCELLKDHTAPLVLAAVDFLIHLYHRLSRYPSLVDDGIEGNPERTSARELHAAALPKVTPRLDAARRARLERLEELAGTERVVTGVGDVLAATLDARVETLLVRSGSARWGAFDAETREARTHDERRPDDEDLHDLAITRALATGSEVYPLDGDGSGGLGDVSIAALLRY